MYQLRVNVQEMKESHTAISSKANTSQFFLSDREVNYSSATGLAKQSLCIACIITMLAMM